MKNTEKADINLKLANIVKEYRELYKYSQYELGLLSRVTATTISKIESGRGCSFDTAVMVTRALGLDLRYFQY